MLILLVGGLTGFLFCAAFQTRIDDKIRRGRDLFHVWQLKRAQKISRPFLIPAISHLAASLRAGISLDGALESAARDSHLPIEARIYLEKVLGPSPPPDFFASFLLDSMRTGAPVLSTLLSFQKVAQIERRVKLKAQAVTGQSRAQAEVLSWMPGVMLAALALTDPDWLRQASASAFSWLLAAISLLLIAGGRAWIRRSLDRALRPKGREEILQETALPDLTLRVISQITVGRDVETALEKSLEQMNDPKLSAAFREESPPDCVAHFRGLLSHSARTGAPVREDLSAYLQDLHLLIENRWEERVQRLPVLLMAPLFVCFFPSSLLVLVGLLAPLLSGAL